MRVVLDTNALFVSISRRSPHHPIFQAFEEKQYDLLVTTDILLEYEEVIGEEMSVTIATNVAKGIREAPNVWHIHKYYFWNLITVDPDDNKFVDCAIAGAADFIVTDDRHFKVLKKIPFPKVEIISADDFVELLTGVRPIRQQKSKNPP
ncbi:MAG: putative toxin-antitoxin system toxin component, PIN family [Saprospiraceae bacterium]|nr:putative toxin-antitoxin system toxin component, PIN family [Saprospiraceae bacterium]